MDCVQSNRTVGLTFLYKRIIVFLTKEVQLQLFK